MLIRKLASRLLAKKSKLIFTNPIFANVCSPLIFAQNKINFSFCDSKPKNTHETPKQYLKTVPLKNYIVEDLSEKDKLRQKTKYIIYSNF